MKNIWLVAGCALWAMQSLCAEWTLEIRNSGFVRENAVLHQAVTREWTDLFKMHMLAEKVSGKHVPVPCALDTSGETPELVWLLPGKTAPYAVRTFVVVPASRTEPPVSDLNVTCDRASITVRNHFYSLKQPASGHGGFPYDITFSSSGTADPNLYFLDRIVRQQNGRLAQYCAKDCDDAEAHIVFQCPLRVTVETRTGFGKHGAETPGKPLAVYRYTYTAFSPVIEVSARYTRQDDGPWSELHFLHLTRTDRHYTEFVCGDPAQTHVIQPKGAHSRSVGAPQWAVMSDGTNACGTGFDGAVCWDAADQFVYYVRSASTTWENDTQMFDGGLYFGPAMDGAGYTRWMGRDRLPDVRFLKNGKAWVPVENQPLTGAHTVENRALRIAFAGAEKGFDCTGIENLLADGGRFVKTREKTAGLWSLTFKTPMGNSGTQSSVTLNNRTKADHLSVEQTHRCVMFFWKGLDLPDEPGAVDVRAEVRLESGTGASAWRIGVTNRSTRYGLWSTDYPVLCGVAARGVADTLLPRGNWGGSLMRHYAGRFEGHYPSHSCPVQFLAYQLGEAGLYLAAHDGAAREKRLTVTREQDVMFQLLAENAGVPGAASAPDYPVVIAAYSGDWWQAARLYREWALKQVWASKGPIRQRTDYPSNLQNLGFWMLLNGKPDGVQKAMQEAERLYADIPVGVHWYCWHQIPFDNSYPEYFPTRDGMADATHAMTARGQTVMPYINARLWDRDIPSFANAYPAACKQPSGTNYVETYGSGRKLVPMCPATEQWQTKVAEVCHRLISECGVNAIYLDQIGAAAPVSCFDASHGHPLGGGRYWADGYRTMLTNIKKEASKSGVALTTENNAEPYMDTVDGYLAWSPRAQEDVPLLPAVYSGYTTYFTSPQSSQDSLDAFCAAQARDFLWGCQLGWNDPWVLRENHREKQTFQYALCRYRLAAKDFFVYGQLVDEVHPTSTVPETTHIWNRNTPHTARLPDVMGTVWKDNCGRLAAFVVNASGLTQAFAFQIEPEHWLGKRGPWRVSTLSPEGTPQSAQPHDTDVLLGDLSPREIRAFVIEPVAADRTK